jgi:hypothetical protein
VFLIYVIGGEAMFRFTNKVTRALSPGGVIGATAKVVSRGELKQWDPDSVTLKENQVCRGVTRAQLDLMLKIRQLTQPKLPGPVVDIGKTDLGTHVMRGSQLLPMARNLYTANLYGANRYFLPRDGAIVVTCKPAIYTDIAKQAIACPQIFEEEQRRTLERTWAGGDIYREVPDVTKLAAGGDEICAVGGSQGGVSFEEMFEVDKFVETIYHVVGTGRPRLGLVPITSCLVDKFDNPDYVERALAVEIVFPQTPEHLAILEDSLRSSGELAPEHRLLTPDDAAVIMSEPELRALATAAADKSGTYLVTSVPKEAYGPNMVDHLKGELKEVLAYQEGVRASQEEVRRPS